MAFDRFPGPAGGDAHFLMIVPGGPARGERVAEPESVRNADFVGDIRECRGALVRRDHQIRIITVMDDRLVRVLDVAIDQIIRQTEQAGDEGLVRFNPGIADRFAATA